MPNPCPRLPTRPCGWWPAKSVARRMAALPDPLSSLQPDPQPDPQPGHTAFARPTLRVAVVMLREAKPNAWEDWRHSLAEVLLDEGQFGARPRVLMDDGRQARTLHPGFELQLHADEAEGYYLNLSTPGPVWFVMWRLDDVDPALARPERVMLSYNEAGRLLDAQERVDNLPLPGAVRDWLQTYTDVHYRPEPKRRRRPASFLAPGAR